MIFGTRFQALWASVRGMFGGKKKDPAPAKDVAPAKETAAAALQPVAVNAEEPAQPAQ